MATGARTSTATLEATAWPAPNGLPAPDANPWPSPGGPPQTAPRPIGDDFDEIVTPADLEPLRGDAAVVPTRRFGRLGDAVTPASSAFLADVIDVFGYDAMPTGLVVIPAMNGLIVEGHALGGPFQRRPFALTGESLRVGKREVSLDEVVAVAHWIVRGDVIGSPTGLTYHVVVRTTDGAELRVVTTGSSRRRSGNGRDMFERITAHVMDVCASPLIEASFGLISGGTAVRIGAVDLSTVGLSVRRRPATSWAAVSGTHRTAGAVEVLGRASDSSTVKLASVPRSVANAVLLDELVARCRAEFA